MKSPVLIFDNCKFSENQSSFLCLYDIAVDLEGVALFLHLFRLIFAFYFLKLRKVFLIFYFLCFETIVFEGHSSLHAGELFAYRQTYHHSTATLTIHLMVRLRLDLFSKWLEVFLGFFPRRSLFFKNFNRVHCFSQSLRVSDPNRSMHRMIFDIFWHLHWIFVNFFLDHFLLLIFFFI